MKYAAIALAWSLLPPPSPALAQTGLAPEAVQDMPPRARIRGAAKGLSPDGFFRWRKDNAVLSGVSRDDIDLPGQAARDFTAADVNGDHRISAVELADWISSRPALALVRARTQSEGAYD